MGTGLSDEELEAVVTKLKPYFRYSSDCLVDECSSYSSVLREFFNDLNPIVKATRPRLKFITIQLTFFNIKQFQAHHLSFCYSATLLSFFLFYFSFLFLLGVCMFRERDMLM